MSKSKKLTLYAKWSKKENAHLYGGISKSDGGMLVYYFEGMKWPDNRNLIEELEYRGYDITTLKFQITKKEI